MSSHAAITQQGCTSAWKQVNTALCRRRASALASEHVDAGHKVRSPVDNLLAGLPASAKSPTIPLRLRPTLWALSSSRLVLGLS